jgi:hypothetical protein
VKRIVFRTLARFNKLVLPGYRNRDLTRLRKIDKLIIGWRIWVTLRAIDR